MTRCAGVGVGLGALAVSRAPDAPAPGRLLSLRDCEEGSRRARPLCYN